MDPFKGTLAMLFKQNIVKYLLCNREIITNTILLQNKFQNNNYTNINTALDIEKKNKIYSL